MKIIATEKLAEMTDNVKVNDILVIDNEVMTEEGDEVHFIKKVDWRIDTHVSIWNNGVICHSNGCDCPCCFGHSSTEKLTAEGQDVLGFYLEVDQGTGGRIFKKSVYGEETIKSEVQYINKPLEEVSDVLDEELHQLDIQIDDVILALNQCPPLKDLRAA